MEEQVKSFYQDIKTTE